MTVPSGSSNLIWHHGRVVSLNGDQAVIRFAPSEICARCFAGEGCGAGIFSKLFAKEGAELSLTTPFDACIGELVAVGIRPHQLVYGALWLYGLPVALFVILLVLGTYGFGLETRGLGELSLLLMATLGAGLSIKLAEHLRSRSLNPIVKRWSCSKDMTNN